MRGSLTASASPVHIDVGVDYKRKKGSRICNETKAKKSTQEPFVSILKKNAKEHDDQKYLNLFSRPLGIPTCKLILS